jgi:hypothetical protein
VIVYLFTGAEVTRRCIDLSLARLCRVKTCHGGGSGLRSPPCCISMFLCVTNLGRGIIIDPGYICIVTEL